MLDVLARVLVRSYAARGLSRARSGRRERSRPAHDVVPRACARTPSASRSAPHPAELARPGGRCALPALPRVPSGYGRDLHRWLLRARLLASLERVAEPRSDLTTVALDFGFVASQSFHGAFRRAFGLTPSELRRQAPARTLARLRTTPSADGTRQWWAARRGRRRRTSRFLPSSDEGLPELAHAAVGLRRPGDAVLEAATLVGHVSAERTMPAVRERRRRAGGGIRPCCPPRSDAMARPQVVGV
jgi:AraC-like DNA-binding protein